MANVDFMIMSIQDKIAAEQTYFIREKMVKKKEGDLPLAIARADLKNKVITLLLAIFLGGLGAHRFYLGDYRIGAAFLGSNVIAYVLMFAMSFVSHALYVVMSLVIGVIGILQFVDIFISYKRTKTVNFNRLNYSLDMLPDEENDSEAEVFDDEI